MAWQQGGVKACVSPSAPPKPSWRWDPAARNCTIQTALQSNSFYGGGTAASDSSADTEEGGGRVNSWLTLRNTRSWRNSQGLGVTRAALNLTDINSMGCSLQQRSGTEHLVSYSLESAETVKSGKQHLLQVFATVNEPQVYSRRFQCRKHRICCLPNAQYTVYLYIYFCFCSTK